MECKNCVKLRKENRRLMRVMGEGSKVLERGKDILDKTIVRLLEKK